MRLWLRVLLTLVVLAGIAIGGWWYLNRGRLSRQWACYRVGAAVSFEQAQAELAWFEKGPDRDVRLGELVGKWGTGNQRFDLYLARHVAHSTSSESLRESFSRQLGRRPELLRRWAHFWSYRLSLEPDREINSITAYFDALTAADRPEQTITWRQALNLQAVFQLTGQGQLALGLTPGNWRDRYGLWREHRPAEAPRIWRPASPFPDWRGPES